jgi:quercetin dioxygenase-like cupin family protein
MQQWHLPTLGTSSDKRRAREAGPDAPRTPTTGTPKPRVLFTSPECRMVALDLKAGDELGDHVVRERAVVQVLSGRVEVRAGGENVECDAETLITFDPGEHHAVRGLEDTRLLLVLAPWPAAGHNAASEEAHDQHLPTNATIHPRDGIQLRWSGDA